MTTIAVRDGIMACDSLVSGDYSCKAVTKIIKGDGCLVGFAGDWIAAHHYAECYVSHSEPSRADDDIELLVLKASGIFLVDANFRSVPIKGDYYAIGSGGQAAMVAMNMGASAVDAVRQAIRVDPGSGPPVKEIHLARLS